MRAKKKVAEKRKKSKPPPALFLYLKNAICCEDRHEVKSMYYYIKKDGTLWLKNILVEYSLKGESFIFAR